MRDLRPLDDRILGRPGVLADTAYGIRLTAQPDALILESDNPAIEWEIWAVQVAALRAGATIVHGAAVADENGRTLLFPSWGGVGKTALVTGFVRDRGWKLLGDDLSYLSRDGTVRSLLKPMVLYPYHRAVFPEIFESGRGPVAPAFLTDALTAAGRRVKPVLRTVPGALRWARQHNPQSAQVPPSKVFGSEGLGTQGRAAAAIWLERVPGLRQAELLDAPDIRSQIFGSTLNEFDPRCVRATQIAMGLGMVGTGDVYGPWLDILERGLAGIPHHRLHMPAEMAVEDVPTVVAELLRNAGVL